MKITDLFFELSHEGRYNIFKELNKEPRKHSQLERRLNLPGPEITRHLKRLLNLQLIQKNLDGTFFRTNFGKIIHKTLHFFEFTAQHLEFLNTHDMTSIPPELMFTMGQLINCQLLTQTMQNIEIWSQIIKDAREFIWAISDQLQYSIIPIMERKIAHQNLEIKGILQTNLLEKFVETEEWEKLLKGSVPEVIDFFHERIGIPKNIRKQNEVRLALVITESKSILFLAGDRGIDYSQCLFAENNEDFTNWAKDLFNYYWNEATEVTLEEILP
ncbi:MAG: helix-turn-helix transcriptional regulator [Candidatus Helarchaeota archaeon]